MPAFIVEQKSCPLSYALGTGILLLLALQVKTYFLHLVMQSGLPIFGRQLGFGVEVGRGMCVCLGVGDDHNLIFAWNTIVCGRAGSGGCLSGDESLHSQSLMGQETLPGALLFFVAPATKTRWVDISCPL